MLSRMDALVESLIALEQSQTIAATNKIDAYAVATLTVRTIVIRQLPEDRQPGSGLPRLEGSRINIACLFNARSGEPFRLRKSQTCCRINTTPDTGGRQHG